MFQLKIRKVGNSLGVTLPADAARRLRVQAGDPVYLTETPDGLRLSKADPTFENGLEIARKAMKTYHNALRELAK